MADEEKKVATGEVDETTQDYIATIKKLKENSVDREKFEKLEAEHKRVLDEIVNGRSTDEEVQQEVLPTIAELRKEMFNGERDLSNLDYVTKALQLRDQLIAKGEPDPFLPYGQQISPSEEDIAAANRVASVLKECVDYAQGDSSVFTNELQRRTNDVRIPR